MKIKGWKKITPPPKKAGEAISEKVYFQAKGFNADRVKFNNNESIHKGNIKK